MYVCIYIYIYMHIYHALRILVWPASAQAISEVHK